MFSRTITALAITLPIVLVLYYQSFWFFSVFIIIVCCAAFHEWVINNFKNNLFGFLLIFNFGFWSIFFIYSSQEAYLFYGIIIINTAIFDSFAYIVGSNYGKTYISKKISPNKTLEGLMGGFFGSLLFIILCALVTDLNFKVSTVLLFGCVFAFLGDLLISYFKRQSGVKDTGSILPGHGGVLDRIDSHLIAAPGIIIIIQLYADLIILI
jgi:phosphatidate cytidylyltransferase